jgi:hypothetical protein
MFAHGDGGVRRSVDGGGTWETIAGGGDSDMVLDPQRSTNLITTSSRGGTAELEIMPDISMDSVLTDIALNQDEIVPIRIVNKGPYAASMVRWSAQLPTQANVVSVQSDQGTCSIQGNVASCDLGAVRAGGVANVSLRLTAASSSSLSMTVASYERELVPADNTLSLSTIASVRHADVGVAFQANGLNTLLVITNRGPDAAVATTVTVQLPEGVTTAQHSDATSPFSVITRTGGGRIACVPNGSSFSCTIPGLAAGSTVEGVLGLKANGAATVLVQSTVTSWRTDPDSSNNSASLMAPTVNPSPAGSPSGVNSQSGGGGGGAFSKLLLLLLVSMFGVRVGARSLLSCQIKAGLARRGRSRIKKVSILHLQWTPI